MAQDDDSLDALLARAGAGLPYDDLAAALMAARERAYAACAALDAARARPPAEREAMLRALLKSVGEGALVEPTFRCEFGVNVTLGRRFYANVDCVILDAAPVTIGDDVLFGPRVGLYSADHAMDAQERAAGVCVAAPIVIGDRVWLGGGVQVTKGVTIGAETVVAAGAVVTRDLPPGVVAAGTPARVLRPIGAGDRLGYKPR